MARILIIGIPVLLLFLLAFVLGLYNGQQTTVDLLVVQLEVTVAIVMAGSLAVGFLLGWLLLGAAWLKMRYRLKRAQKRLRKYDQRPV